MARRRFFVDSIRDGEAEIAGDDAHHLARVLRAAIGQKFEITDAREVWLASVESVAKTRVTFRTLEKLDAGPPLPDITLYLALIKFEKFEWAVEKATELGVTRIVPVETSRSEQGLFEGAAKRSARWIKIARESSEQSRRLSPPIIAPAIRLKDALSDRARHRLWLDERPGAPPLLAAFQPMQGEHASFLIGPEGGWTDHEREALSAAGWQPATLGPLVLRAETAVCATLSLATQVWISAPPIQSNQ